MIEPFVYQALPQRILFGAGRIAETAEAVRALGCSRALVLSTKEQREAAERVAGLLGELSAGVFAGAVMHTPVEVTEEAMRAYADLRADCVVSIGGGSTTGLGKAIALRTDAPQVVIPTTYAGSEVTSILGETQGGVKTTQRSPKILPEVVIYDAELTLSLPPKLSATSGMNAMAHAVEALYAKDRNPITSLMAEEGLRALAASLPAIVRDPLDRPARAQAQYGAWLCGMCLAATSMALHHKLCHVLGGAFDLPHAETHTIVLPHATAYNAPAAPEAMQKIARALGAKSAARGLYELAAGLSVPLGLKEIGMPESGIERAVELAVERPLLEPAADRGRNPSTIDHARLRRRAARGGMTEEPMRNFDENTITEAVLEQVGKSPSPRIRQISEAAARHLHNFVREVEPTMDEWEWAIRFLTETGQLCSSTRQEFILLSDTFGVSMLVDAINHRFSAGATETTVLGPFYVQDPPVFALGADISPGMAGEPLYVEGSVRGSDGRPLAGRHPRRLAFRQRGLLRRPELRFGRRDDHARAAARRRGRAFLVLDHRAELLPDPA